MYAEPEFDTSAPEPDKQAWRDELASRVSSYRARRRHKVEGDRSMRLDFDAVADASPREAVASVLADRFPHPEGVADTNYYRRMNTESREVVDPDDEVVPADDPEQDARSFSPNYECEYTPVAAGSAADIPIVTYDPESDPDFDFELPRADAAEPETPKNLAQEARRVAAAARNLIHFPKPSGMEPPSAPPVYDFAEPVIDRPRILDVPEDTMPTIRGPLFADIRLDDPQTDEAVVAKFQAQIEVPLQVAAVSQRIFSGLIDALVVLIAYGIFVVIGWTVLPEIPRTKGMALLAVAVPAAFWFVYQYLFLVYAGQTTGMQMAQIHLRTFDGRQPSWQERRHRALAMLLSCISVGLGFLWAMIDEDTLCWHDKISRTYPIQR